VNNAADDIFHLLAIIETLRAACFDIAAPCGPYDIDDENATREYYEKLAREALQKADQIAAEGSGG
jgi:hypothetical protein